MVFVINEPTMSCCGMPTGQCRCKETTQTELRKRIHDIVDKRARQIVSERPTTEADSLRNNVIPMPAINWEAEQKARLQSYLGKGTLPAGAKVEEEEPAPFVERTFSDLLRAESVPKAPPPPDPRYSPLVTNLPDVKGDVLPTASAMWAEAVEEDRRRLGL